MRDVIIWQMAWGGSGSLILHFISLQEFINDKFISLNHFKIKDENKKTQTMQA
jgi:hypothetical protein